MAISPLKGKNQAITPAPDKQDAERDAKEALESRYLQRAAAEIEHLIIRALTYRPPFQVKITAFGFVHEVVLPRFRDALEELVPHDTSAHPRSDRDYVLGQIADAVDFAIQSSAEQFSLLSNGRISIPPIAHFRALISQYLQNRRYDAIIIGKYFDTFAPIEENLETSRFYADHLLEKLADLLRETPALAEEIRQNSDFQLIFRTAAAPKVSAQPLPARAPELWENRADGSGETSLGFLRRVYGPWLESMSSDDLRAIDEPLYQTLKQWSVRNKPPKDLKAFFGTFKKRRSREEVEAELIRYKIKKPADAFERFPNDPKKARRLYQAAKARL